MFKTVFKMSTTTPSKPLFEWVFDILNTDFDIFYKFPKYTKCFNIFTNYTVWKHKFLKKINVRWQKCTIEKDTKFPKNIVQNREKIKKIKNILTSNFTISEK